MSEIDFSEWVLTVDGATLDGEGYYRCEDCGDILEAEGELDRSRDYMAAWWRCPDCGTRFSISGADSRPEAWVQDGN